MPLIIEQPQHLNGVIRAIRTNTGRCAIVWTFRDREVWIGDRPEAGPKRALYEFLRNTPRDAERLMLRLEADAEHILGIERQRDEEAFDEEIALYTFEIESDPYVG